MNECQNHVFSYSFFMPQVACVTCFNEQYGMTLWEWLCHLTVTIDCALRTRSTSKKIFWASSLSQVRTGVSTRKDNSVPQGNMKATLWFTCYWNVHNIVHYILHLYIYWGGCLVTWQPAGLWMDGSRVWFLQPTDMLSTLCWRAVPSYALVPFASFVNFFFFMSMSL